jgi:hypothetical protein
VSSVRCLGCSNMVARNPPIAEALARAKNGERSLGKRKLVRASRRDRRKVGRASSSLSTEPPKTPRFVERGREDEDGGHIGMTPPDTSDVENAYLQTLMEPPSCRRLRVALSATLSTFGPTQAPGSGERGLFVTSLTTTHWGWGTLETPRWILVHDTAALVGRPRFDVNGLGDGVPETRWSGPGLQGRRGLPILRPSMQAAQRTSPKHSQGITVARKNGHGRWGDRN